MSLLRPIPAAPRSPCLPSATFVQPPLDGSLTFQEILDFNGSRNGSHRLFAFTDEKGGLQAIHWREGVKAFRVAASIVKRVLNQHNIRNDERPVVAILAQAVDTITYITLAMGIERANCTLFPLSPRNSPSAVAHLLDKVDARHVFLGQEQAMSDLFKDASQLMMSQNPTRKIPSTSVLPRFEDFFAPDSDDSDNEIGSRKPDDVLMFLHSSGSTAYPKPIPYTNQRLVEVCLKPHFGERNLNGVVFGIHGLPVYHAMGIAQLNWSAGTGMILGVYGPKSVMTPTPDNVFNAVRTTGSDVIFTVPAFLEAWSRNPDYVKWLATRMGVFFGGGPLAKQTGDFLTSQGVAIFVLYGVTEGGVVTLLIPEGKADKDWEYFKFSGNIGSLMRPYEGDRFELIYVTTAYNTPILKNMKVNGIDAYASSDLLAAHPTRPGYWKVYGRLDDQIVHSTGEKTNPGPLENIVDKDKHIRASVVFGTGQFMTGVVVEANPQYAIDPTDEDKLAEFRNLIWPSIRKANDISPQHSRIFKEMILVASPSKPFEYTGKGTARRPAIIQMYQEEIDNLYQSVSESTQPDIPPPTQWDEHSTLDFVRAVVRKVLQVRDDEALGDEDDLFENGCDSLQATWIRNTVLRGLRDSAHVETRNITENFTYEHPSIKRLALYASHLASGAGIFEIDPEERIKKMHELLAKYTANLEGKQNGSAVPLPSKKRVLVNGTTGAFGPHILSALLHDPDVSDVYALGRPHSSRPLSERQKASCSDAGLQADELIASKKLHLIEADLTRPDFGITADLYNEMQNNVTHIINNAWRVDFNVGVEAFDANFKALRNLVDFSLSSPYVERPSIAFTSSMSVFNYRQSTDKEPFEEAGNEARLALGNGYSESKWVGEQILEHVGRKTPVKTIIVRIGQLCGGQNGSWNTKEWFPIIVQGSLTIKCLPTQDRLVSWIPTDVAARALVDFCGADLQEGATYVHLVHPRPARFSALMSTISSELKIPTVTYDEWLAKLETFSQQHRNDDAAAAHAVKKMPALRLLSFFKHLKVNMEKATDVTEAMGMPKLANAKALKMSPTLANPSLPTLGRTQVLAWLAYWKKGGLLPSNHDE